MRYKVFLDTNILLSGIFFEGNESLILDLVEMALTDISIIPRTKYHHKLKEAESLVAHKKDIPILAAVLFTEPDYFLTGDEHFFTDKIKEKVNVITARDFLEKIK